MEDVRSYNELLGNEKLEQNMQQKLKQRVKEVENNSLQTMATIAHTIDAKDSYKNGHSERVAKYSVEIGRRIGIKGNELSNLYYVALLHDIGSIGIPDAIIGKPSSLTLEEYEIIKTHTLIGDNILKGIDIFPKLRDGARSHHEHFDGKGYPDGLKREEIPMNARIIGMADAYDAMVSNRSYRKEYTFTEVKKEIFRCRETQFDPLVADILLEMLDEGFNISIDTKQQVEDFDSTSDNILILQRLMKDYAQDTYNNIYKDTLTNVWNRDYIKKYVDGYLSTPLNRGIMFMLDLDNFKSVNDIYGHSAGDNIIINLANTMKEIIGDIGIISRIGGDEFVVFFPNEDDNDYIRIIAEKIINAVKSKIGPTRKGCGVSVSIGIAQSDIAINSFEKLFDNADKALYYVKEHGKGHCHTYDDREFSLHNDRGVEADVLYLKKKLEEDGIISGAYRVGYDGFTKIYQFVSRSMERTEQNGILVLYTIFETNGNLLDSAVLAECMITLETAIVKSIRKGDVTTRYSDYQQLVMILDADKHNGRLVARRIYDIFKQNFGEKIEIKFEITDIRT
ncbi:diguanylate cyclase domain-containing protein [[Clostridium] fimetarium]|uniref:Diguanylate cyclase (GGDEF) domain-containing protein n=1 Tax=[Clostridium] fimetarium TaxID=99656 RepID=A0A1I0M257_9FIRM|nr:diguanylate cyclase [[Clostridium] fimetarium]SEV81318.1 diguanylate cyclase (GGDEF) domain-containing protein [[Clostridium] fimetarium]